jgi:hypothetical protein
MIEWKREVVSPGHPRLQKWDKERRRGIYVGQSSATSGHSEKITAEGLAGETDSQDREDLVS